MTTDMTHLEARLVALESKLTLAEDLLDELNRTVFRQQEHIDALTRGLIQVRQQFAGGDAAPSLPVDERPPHY